MSDPKRILDSVYNDFFGEETKKEILEGTKKLMDEMGDDLDLSKLKEPDFIGSLEEELDKEVSSVNKDKNASKADAGKPENLEDKEKDTRAETKKEDEEDPMEELNSLIGLSDLKKDVCELVNLMKLQKMREERGMKSVSISKHLVFSGNPGTGKTTVARILAKLYKQAGILSKGQLVEVDRSGLVAGYVGQTAIKTQEKIQEAMGGILFVDEAYALVKEGQDYGQEAIDTILKAMEDNRDDFVVIVAGYPDLMKTFIESNPGLRSRFNKYFFFDDYNEELAKWWDDEILPKFKELERR